MASIAASTLPIPPKLYKHLAHATTPWALHEDLFERVREQEWSTADNTFKSCEILPSDPEYDFVHEYFLHGKPPGACITKITCIHNPAHTAAFEAEIKNMEAEAKKFLPKGAEEEPKEARAQALQRWHELVEPFSPLKVKAGRRTDKFDLAKVLPLWHGSNKAKCDSIASSGFSYFGKHHFFGAATKSPQASTDIGYFGSGIYFTDSARYAALYSDGHILLSWVSMREPYPVVSDVPHPKKCSDMRKLEGKGAYQKYNAHYVPIVSIAPEDPDNMEYHPCFQGELAPWDEIVVFHKSQTLPRFAIELGTDLPPTVSQAKEVPTTLAQTQATIEDLIEHLSALLDIQPIQQDSQICDILKHKAKIISVVNPETPLSPKDIEFYHCTKNLIDRAGKVRSFIKENLLEITGHQKPVPKKPFVATSLPSSPVKSPLIPAIAFGKAKWEHYFGDIGVEPPLPPDINTILQSPCPIFPDKTVQETHMLVLIPKTVNGRALTLNSLGELVKHPKQGNQIQYGPDSWTEIFKTLGDQPISQSSWILVTKDVLPGSRSKSYEDQCKLVESYSQKAKASYQVPYILEAATSIFLEYVQNGTRLYVDNPLTYTRCQEKITYQLVVGCFAPAGLDVDSIYDDRSIIGVGGVRKLC